jgi:uncharacterized protein (TIGR00730 family)
MGKVLVFCGAARGIRPEMVPMANEVGKTIAKSGCEVVYGGSQDGLMGAVADGALSEGGKVTGVIPRFLSRREIAHKGATEMIEVDSMAERKDILFSKSDMILVLPGGLGTLDELFEALTMNQLGRFIKPVAILNFLGFYSGLLNWLESLQSEGFVSNVSERFVVLHDTAGLVEFLK